MNNELKQWNIYKITSNAPLDSERHFFKANPLDPNSPEYKRNWPIKPRETFYVKPIRKLKNDEIYLVAHLTSDKKDKAKKFNPVKIDNMIESNLPKNKRPHGKIIPINVRFALKSEFYDGDKLKSSSQGFVPSVKTKLWIDGEISRLMTLSGRNYVMTQVMRGDFDNYSEEELKDFVSIKQFNATELGQKYLFDKDIIQNWTYKMKGIPLSVLNNTKYSEDCKKIVENAKANVKHSIAPNETPLITKNGKEFLSSYTKEVLEAKKEFHNKQKQLRNISSANSSNNNEPEEA